MSRAPSSGGASDDLGWLGNAGSLVAGRLVVAALGWGGTIIIARSLDQDTFGRFTFVFGLLGMMTIVTDLGLGRIALSGVLPEATDRRAFGGAYIVLRVGLGVVGYLVAIGLTVLGRYPAEIVRATAIAGLVVVLATASHAYEIALQAQLRMHVVAVAGVVGRLGQLAFTIAVAMAGGGLLWFLVPAIVAELLIMAVKVPPAIRLLSPRYSIRPALWSVMLKEAIPLSIGAALATLYFRVDSIMLSKLDDFAAVGVYGVAFKFVDVLHFVALSISAPLLTVLVRAWPDDPAAFLATIRRTASLFALMSGALLVHFSLFAVETIAALYGPSYSDGARATTLLVIGQVLAFSSVVGLTILTATSAHRPYPYVAMAGLAANVALNLWAIPRWSFEGAAAATIVTEAVVVIAMWSLVRRLPELGRIGPGPLLRVVPAIAIAVGYGLLIDSVGPWPIAAAVAMATYGVTAIATGAVREAGVPALVGWSR